MTDMSKREFHQVRSVIHAKNKDTYWACSSKKFFRLEWRAKQEVEHGIAKKYLKPSAYAYKCPHCVGYHVTNGETVKDMKVKITQEELLKGDMEEFELAVLYKMPNTSVKKLVNCYQVTKGKLNQAEVGNNDELIRAKNHVREMNEELQQVNRLYDDAKGDALTLSKVLAKQSEEFDERELALRQKIAVLAGATVFFFLISVLLALTGAK